MKNLNRYFNIDKIIKQNSFFLFGARATGKTALLKSWIQAQPVDTVLYVDLLHAPTYIRLSADPSELEMMALSTVRTIVIDEVQRVPDLLNEVHRLMELRKLRFILSGSSARKLRKAHSNLLAGRAWRAELFPFVHSERTQVNKRNLLDLLRWGCLPRVFFSESPRDELDAYVSTYLKEEIQTEGWVRDLPSFLRFLKVAALNSGDLLNFSQVGSDVGLSSPTIREYFEILSETLLGKLLEPFQESKKRKAITTPKFYFFDSGVFNELRQTPNELDASSDTLGKSLEHLVCHELHAGVSYFRTKHPITFWRTKTQDEVDFLVGTDLAIEVKATKRIGANHLKGLSRLGEEKIFKHRVLVSLDPQPQERDGILCLPLNDFLTRWWEREWV